MASGTGNADFYNRSYEQANYFHYNRWLYQPYVGSLVSYCGLKKGSSVLDVGCGQGFFAYLFQRCGMRVHGVDMSETGIRVAQQSYGASGITFAVADIETATFPERFDCVFVRSFSLYNNDQFPKEFAVTDILLRHLNPGGTLIFAYNSNFSSKVSKTWRYHSLADVREHFSHYEHARVFFLNRFTSFLFRTHALTPVGSSCNALLSRKLGLGGDLICILRKN